MNDPAFGGIAEGSGELARLAAIARVAAAKGWSHYAERLGLGPQDAGPQPKGSDARRRLVTELRGRRAVRIARAYRLASAARDVASETPVHAAPPYETAGAR